MRKLVLHSGIAEVTSKQTSNRMPIVTRSASPQSPLPSHGGRRDRPPAVLAAVLALLFLGTVPLSPAQAQGFEKYRDVKEYDKHFRKYSKRFFGVGSVRATTRAVCTCENPACSSAAAHCCADQTCSFGTGSHHCSLLRLA